MNDYFSGGDNRNKRTHPRIIKHVSMKPMFTRGLKRGCDTKQTNVKSVV